MKQDTLEGKAKTKNGVKRLCFSIVCILLEVVFIITIVTRLNEYAEIINLFTRILSGILVLGLYASDKTSSMKMPWVILILIFPIMGVGLYLLIGLNGGTHKMRERYAEIDSKLLPMLSDNQECLNRINETIPKAGNIASYIQRNSQYPIYQNTDRGKSAKEISEILGFEDLATFSRFFKKMNKESLSEYRKREKRE